MMNAFSVLAQIAGQSHLNKSTHKQTESELFSEVFRYKNSWYDKKVMHIYRRMNKTIVWL